MERLDNIHPGEIFKKISHSRKTHTDRELS